MYHIIFRGDIYFGLNIALFFVNLVLNLWALRDIWIKESSGINNLILLDSGANILQIGLCWFNNSPWYNIHQVFSTICFQGDL